MNKLIENQEQIIEKLQDQILKSVGVTTLKAADIRDTCLAIEYASNGLTALINLNKVG